MRIKNHFQINGFAISLALKRRFGATRKWPQYILPSLFIQSISQFLIGLNPRLILHNQL